MEVSSLIFITSLNSINHLLYSKIMATVQGLPIGFADQVLELEIRLD